MTINLSDVYDSFAKGLQTELAEAVADRPKAVTQDLFIGKTIKDQAGQEQVIDPQIICFLRGIKSLSGRRRG